MKPTEITLKEPDPTPLKWWFLFGTLLLLATGYLLTQRILPPAQRPEDIPDAMIVTQSPDTRLIPTGNRETPSVVVEVEPGAPEKSELYPNAITNYFEQVPVETAQHPLDPALHVSELGLKRLQAIQAYQAKITKRERLKGELAKSETMEAKIRRPATGMGKATVPFSVYLKFLSPKSVAGREVLWVEGRDGNKMLVREAGFLGVLPIFLDPEGTLAMSGSRYPIWEIGFDVLIQRMIEKGTRDRLIGESMVRVDRWVELNGRPCTLIVIEHPEFKEGFDFQRAEIVIDDELNVPIHYAAYGFPESEGGRPLLLEQYTYRDVVLDVELSDWDFDRDNPAYSF